MRKSINKANTPAPKKAERTVPASKKSAPTPVSSLTPAQLAQAKKQDRATEHHLSKNPEDFTWN
jgi:hypothetical protein